MTLFFIFFYLVLRRCRRMEGAIFILSFPSRRIVESRRSNLRLQSDSRKARRALERGASRRRRIARKGEGLSSRAPARATRQRNNRTNGRGKRSVGENVAGEDERLVARSRTALIRKGSGKGWVKRHLKRAFFLFLLA